MVRDEILEILDLLDNVGVSEENKRKIFSDGLFFDFTYGDPDPKHKNRHLNIFGIGMLIKTLKEERNRISINKIIDAPHTFYDDDLIRAISDIQSGYSRIRKLGK